MAAVLGKKRTTSAAVTLLKGLTVTCLLFGVSACGNKTTNAATGQSLARVNGQEITVHQLNEELAHSNVSAQQKDAASKQLLDSLIDRQLLLGAATLDKVDRDPVVMQAIERAKAQIMAQAYMQKRLVKVARPTKEEIDKYYADHPDLFAERRQFEMEQLMISSKDFTPELKAMLVPGKTMEDVLAWVKEHKIENIHNTAMRSSANVPAPLLLKFKDMRKGQMFALQEGSGTMISVIRAVKEDRATPEAADPQIGNFLLQQRTNEAAEAEITRLRASAKIEYLNQKAIQSGSANPPAESTSNSTTNSASEKQKADDHTRRGVADL